MYSTTQLLQATKNFEKVEDLSPNATLQKSFNKEFNQVSNSCIKDKKDWGNLNAAIVHNVVNYLDTKDAINISQLNKHWNIESNSDMNLRKSFQLYSLGWGLMIPHLERYTNESFECGEWQIDQLSFLLKMRESYVLPFSKNIKENPHTFFSRVNKQIERFNQELNGVSFIDLLITRHNDAECQFDYLKTKCDLSNTNVKEFMMESVLGNAQALDSLIQLKAIQISDTDQNELLRKSIGSDKTGETLKVFLQYTKNVNRPISNDKLTLAHYAVAVNNTEALKLLIAHGANLGIRSTNDYLPLDYFALQGVDSYFGRNDPEMLEILFKSTPSELITPDNLIEYFTIFSALKDNKLI